MIAASLTSCEPTVTSALSFRGVGKRYTKLDQQAMLVRFLVPFKRPMRTPLWALRDVDLDIAPGDVLGVIGRNGAGKSTLLRLMAGVTQPTEGAVTIAGRVAPLLSVGVGFHQEMSGRENVFVNGMLLGLTRDEIEARFDDIIAFAELEEFVDTPVKFYSSGMFMRLGFSVAVHTDPQILLIDEILAVGDVAFQLKCYDRMREIREGGATLVVVSHSMNAISMLCARTAVFAHGRLMFDGPTDRAIEEHYRLLEAEGPEGGLHVSGAVKIVDQELFGPDGPRRSFSADEPMRLHTRFRFEQPVDDPIFQFQVRDERGIVAYGVMTPMQGACRSFEAGESTDVELGLTARLEGGNYWLTTTVTSADGREAHYTETRGREFFVAPRAWTYGIAKLDGTISVDGDTLIDERNHRLDAVTEPQPAEPWQP